MKHKFYYLLIAAMLCISVVTANAAEPAETASEPIQAVTDTQAVMPVDIITSDDKLEIRKVYDLSPELTEDMIPKDSFELNGFNYSFFEMLKSDVEITECKLHEETVTVPSSSNDTTTVLALLEKTKEITTDDGYTGILYLDNDSIKTAVSGYGSKSYTVTATRYYPNLSDADLQFIPKTIEDNGRTLTFQNVQWQQDTSMNADDYEIGTRYTATVTYSGTASKSYVKGYTVTASYGGEITRTNLDKVRYTVIYTGEAIPEEDTGLPGWSLWGIPLAALLLGGGGLGAAMLLKRRNRKESYYEEDTDYEEESGYDDYGDYDTESADDFDGGSGTGS